MYIAIKISDLSVRNLVFSCFRQQNSGHIRNARKQQKTRFLAEKFKNLDSQYTFGLEKPPTLLDFDREFWFVTEMHAEKQQKNQKKK